MEPGGMDDKDVPLSFHQHVKNKFAGYQPLKAKEEKAFSISGMWSNVELGLVKERASSFVKGEEPRQQTDPKVVPRTKAFESYSWVANSKDVERQQARTVGQKKMSGVGSPEERKQRRASDDVRTGSAAERNAGKKCAEDCFAQREKEKLAKERQPWESTEKTHIGINKGMSAPGNDEAQPALLVREKVPAAAASSALPRPGVNLVSVIASPSGGGLDDVTEPKKWLDESTVSADIAKRAQMFAQEAVAKQKDTSDEQNWKLKSTEQEKIRGEAEVKRQLNPRDKIAVQRLATEEEEEAFARQQRMQQIEGDLLRQKTEEERRLRQIEEDRRRQESELNRDQVSQLAAQKQKLILEAKRDDDTDQMDPDEVRKCVERKLEDQRQREERRARRTHSSSSPLPPAVVGRGQAGEAGLKANQPPPPPRDSSREALQQQQPQETARIAAQQQQQPVVLSQQERWRMKRAEEERKEREWLEIKKLEEEQAEIMLRAQEKQIHNEQLSPQQRDVLKHGIHALLAPPVPPPPVPERKPRRPRLQPRLSVEEEEKLQRYEELKRSESETEERTMRSMESMELRRRESMEEERRKANGPTEADPPTNWRPPVMSQISVEEEKKLQLWEELKRQDSEAEERMLRQMEKAGVREGQDLGDNERLMMQESIHEDVKKSTQQPSTCPGPVQRNSPLKTQLSVEEGSRLKEWEAIKRRESEEEELTLRQMERDLELQSARAAELERQKFQEAIERQCMEDDLRMQRDQAAKAKAKKEEEAQSPTRVRVSSQDSLTWEQIRRQQEEQEEEMRLLTERELERQRNAHEQSRKKQAMEEYRQLEEKKKMIADMTIHEEEDTVEIQTVSESQKDLDWEKTRLQQEEKEEQIRIAMEREMLRQNPSATQKREQQMAEQLRNRAMTRRPILEEEHVGPKEGEKDRLMLDMDRRKREVEEQLAREKDHLRALQRLQQDTHQDDCSKQMTLPIAVVDSAFGDHERQRGQELERIAELKALEERKRRELAEIRRLKQSDPVADGVQETAGAVKDVAQTLLASVGKGLAVDAAASSGIRVSSGSEDDACGYSEGCEELSIGIDLPAQEQSSGADTPVPTTGELEDISSEELLHLLTPPRTPLKSLLKKLSFDNDDSPLPLSDMDDDCSSAKKVHFSETHQVQVLSQENAPASID